MKILSPFFIDQRFFERKIDNSIESLSFMPLGGAKPMTFGGVPIGVASPPIDAENEVMSIIAVA